MSLKASQMDGEKSVHDAGDIHNYVSFDEAGKVGQELLDKLVASCRAVKIQSSQEVLKRLGPKARPTLMPCIV